MAKITEVTTYGSANSPIDFSMAEMETQDRTPENAQELSHGTQGSAQELCASYSVPENGPAWHVC